MKITKITLLLLLCIALNGHGQNNVGINDDNSSPNASAMLDVYSSSKGLLIPRIALTSTSTAAPISSPETSLLIYNTATTGDVNPGYYYWASEWVRLVASADPSISLNVVSKSANSTLLKTETMVLASGDITLTLPTITSADDGLEIAIKNVGTYTDLVIVKPESGKKIDASDSSMHTRWRGKTYLAQGSNWIEKEKQVCTDNVLEVGAQGSFTTISEAIAFLNEHISGPSVVQIGPGEHSITSTQTINFAYPVSFQGVTFGGTTITCPDDGSTAFDVQTECYFKMMNYYAGTNPGICINLSGAVTYYEIKDGYFVGFTKAVILSNSVDLWLFEVDFEDCTVAGVEVNAGSINDAVFKISECDFINCAIGLNLISGGPGSEVSILNATFYNQNSGQTGISYVPTTGNNNFQFSTMIIQNNSFNNIGNFSLGFDFSRADGRDAEAFIENNAGVVTKRPHVKVNVVDNTLTTTINSAGTWYKANYINTVTHATKWTVANNKITYQSLNVRDLLIFISGNIRCSSQNKTVKISIVKNGDSSIRYGETTLRITTANQSFQYSTNAFIENVHKDDYFEIFMTSSSNSDVLTIDDLNWCTDTH